MILLDTCTLLWLVMDQTALGKSAKQVLRSHRGSLFVSAITAFEIGQKHASGKLLLPMVPERWFAKSCDLHGLNLIPLLPRHAFRASALPLHHRDPFDRLLIGTAAVENLRLLTPDDRIHQYTEIEAVW